MLPEACQGKRRKKTLIQWSILLVVLLFIVTLASLALLYLENSGALATFFAKVADLGVWSNVILIFLLAITNFPFALGWMLVVIFCGFLYGFFIGLLTVVIGTTIGCIIVFLLLRYFFRQKAIDYIEKKGGYVARATLYELERHQIKVSFMVRAGPVPPGLQNSILAMSPMGVGLYSVTSFFGFLMKEIPFVYVGSGIKSFTEVASGTSENSIVNYLMFILGFFAVVIMIIFIIFISRKAMADAKKLQIKEEAAKKQLEENLKTQSLTLGENGSEINSAIFTSRPRRDPFQYSDPVLEFFGLTYDVHSPSVDIETPVKEDNEESRLLDMMAKSAPV